MPTCRQCGEPLKSGSTVTCLKSTCQEAEYHANKARNTPKRRLKPKAGAKKADGTVWTPQPGGIEKLELPVPTKTSNEYLFAKLLVEVSGHIKFDYSMISTLNEVMGGYDVSEVLDRAEAVVARTEAKRS